MRQKRGMFARGLFVWAAVVTLPLLGLCQNATWTGQVQCELSIQSNAYAHQETQTWTISGAPVASGAIQVYPATWSVAGQGAMQPTQPGAPAAQWTISVTGMSAPLGVFVRVSDNRLVIKSYHAQLVAQGAVTGMRQISVAGAVPIQSSVQYAATEWVLPVIEDDPTSTSV